MADPAARFFLLLARLPPEDVPHAWREAIGAVERVAGAAARSGLERTLSPRRTRLDPAVRGDPAQFLPRLASLLDSPAPEGWDRFVPSKLPRQGGQVGAALLSAFAQGPEGFLESLAAAGKGAQMMETFESGSLVSVKSALAKMKASRWRVGLQPRLDDKPMLLSALGASATESGFPAGIPEGIAQLCRRYRTQQYLVLQPGPAGNLRPHVDYHGTAVFYVILNGSKTIHIWPPFGSGNMATLADSFVADSNCALELRGDHVALHASAGESVFIPPGWPHFVENDEGGSAAWGINIVTPASHGILAALRNTSTHASGSQDAPLTQLQRAVFAFHYLPLESRGAVAFETFSPRHRSYLGDDQAEAAVDAAFDVLLESVAPALAQVPSAAAAAAAAAAALPAAWAALPLSLPAAASAEAAAAAPPRARKRSRKEGSGSSSSAAAGSADAKKKRGGRPDDPDSPAPSAAAAAAEPAGTVASKRKRAADSEDKEKRPPNAFGRYCMATRERVRQLFPNLEPLLIHEKLRQMWSEEPPALRASHSEEAHAAMDEWRASTDKYVEEKKDPWEEDRPEKPISVHTRWYRNVQDKYPKPSGTAMKKYRAKMKSLYEAASDEDLQEYRAEYSEEMSEWNASIEAWRIKHDLVKTWKGFNPRSKPTAAGGGGGQAVVDAPSAPVAPALPPKPKKALSAYNRWRRTNVDSFKAENPKANRQTIEKRLQAAWKAYSDAKDPLHFLPHWDAYMAEKAKSDAAISVWHQKHGLTAPAPLETTTRAGVTTTAVTAARPQVVRAAALYVRWARNAYQLANPGMSALNASAALNLKWVALPAEDATRKIFEAQEEAQSNLLCAAKGRSGAQSAAGGGGGAAAALPAAAATAAAAGSEAVAALPAHDATLVLRQSETAPPPDAAMRDAPPSAPVAVATGREAAAALPAPPVAPAADSSDATTAGSETAAALPAHETATAPDAAMQNVPPPSVAAEAVPAVTAPAAAVLPAAAAAVVAEVMAQDAVLLKGAAPESETATVPPAAPVVAEEGVLPPLLPLKATEGDVSSPAAAAVVSPASLETPPRSEKKEKGGPVVADAEAHEACFVASMPMDTSGQ